MSLRTPPTLLIVRGACRGSTSFQTGPEWGSLVGASRRGFHCHRRQATPPIREAMMQLRSGKAPGPDGIPVELYKTYVDILVPWLGEVYREARQEGGSLNYHIKTQ
ncbi:hypothetical protein NDU88_005529 [Pleurodeles waltl]|uniref:Uncharacterized protein n=1 Tax=Pleurodeles waltl TaxID=8319 RepID=A0AAV7LPS1_PLEWA|nr:hypothetical protein NDU88_005529 [Pleurodeles waltl]